MGTLPGESKSAFNAKRRIWNKSLSGCSTKNFCCTALKFCRCWLHRLYIIHENFCSKLSNISGVIRLLVSSVFFCVTLYLNLVYKVGKIKFNCPTHSGALMCDKSLLLELEVRRHLQKTDDTSWTTSYIKLIRLLLLAFLLYYTKAYFNRGRARYAILLAATFLGIALTHNKSESTKIKGKSISP